MVNINKKIKKNLDYYLEFDSNLLFQNTDYLVIFGGAIRDSIAQCDDDYADIKDVDILCLSQSMKVAQEVVMKYGYTPIPLSNIDIACLYNIQHVIFEPITYINKNFKRIQFIRPSGYYFNRKSYKLSYFSLLENVDLSCCGVFYNGILYESIAGAVDDCLSHTFYVCKQNSMYNQSRISNRIRKLFERNWVEYQLKTDIKYERAKKIQKIFSDIPTLLAFKNQLLDTYKLDIYLS